MYNVDEGTDKNFKANKLLIYIWWIWIVILICVWKSMPDNINFKDFYAPLPLLFNLDFFLSYYFNPLSVFYSFPICFPSCLSDFWHILILTCSSGVNSLAQVRTASIRISLWSLDKYCSAQCCTNWVKEWPKYKYTYKLQNENMYM